MKSIALLSCVLGGLNLVSAQTATSTTSIDMPESIDASSYLHQAFPTGVPQPTWATGEYYTTLASTLYSIQKSFIQRSDYQTIVNAIWSAADVAGTDVVASLSSSYWNWGAITTNTWYQTNVPTSIQTQVVDYNKAWISAETSIMAVVTSSSKAGAAPRCTGIAVAGVAAAGVVAGVAGVI